MTNVEQRESHVMDQQVVRDHNADDDGTSSSAQIQSPNAPAPGWLSHIPVLEPNQFPRALVPFSYDDGREETLSTSFSGSSSSFTQYLTNTHPAYAPPTALEQSDLVPVEASSRQSQNNPNAKSPTRRSLVDRNRDEVTADVSTLDALPRFRDDSSRLNISREPNSNFIQHHANNAFSHEDQMHQLPSNDIAPHDYEHDSSWNSNLSFSRLPPTPQVIQYRDDISARSPLIDPALYHIDRLNRHLPSVSQNHHQLNNNIADEDDESNDDETEPELNPDLSLAGKKRKWGSEGRLPLEKRKTQPVKRQNAKGERKRGRRKGEIRGPRTTIDPGENFMRVFNEAMDTFLEGNDLNKAQALVLQAIGMNPEIFAAHSLLADIHFARGDHDMGSDALMVGLHAHLNDIELWRQVADTIMSHNDESHQKRVERAMYCYGAILRKNQKDLDARFQRAECARIMGSWNRAFSDFQILLNDDPHNSFVLTQFAKLCEDLGDIPKAISVYEEHFDYYRSNGLSDKDHFTWQDIGIYVDLMVQTGETAQAIVMLKRLARWLCGREQEVFWEEFLEDDRELDQTHYPRRLEVPQFEPNKYPEQDYGEAFPLDLRGKLGVLRMKLNFREEAQSHFDWLEPDLEGEESLVEEYSDTFYEIAKALHDAKEHEQALHFYNALYNADIDLGLDFYLDMAASCYVCGQKDRAIQFYEKVLELDTTSIDARVQLTKLYRDLGNRQMALKYGNEAVVLAQELIPVSTNRKYERRENRVQREAAENALKDAFRIPKGPGKAPGKVPKGLSQRNRYRRKFVKWVPKFDTPPASTPTPTPPAEVAEHDEDMDSTTAPSPVPVDVVDEEPPLPDKPIKVAKKKGRPPKPKPARRKPPDQGNAAKHYEGMQQLYKTLIGHQDAMREGDEVSTNVWMDCAAAMVEDFRSVKVFFPGERHKKFEGYTMQTPRPGPRTMSIDTTRVSETRNSVEGVNDLDGVDGDRLYTPLRADVPIDPSARRLAPEGVADEYCDIPFSTWLDIFLELALLWANSSTSDSQQECYALINACIDCTLFYQDEASMVQIHSCFLACCLALGDDLTLYNTVLRWFMREYAFCTDTYRLYTAVTLINELPPVANQMNDAVFKSAPNQKFIFRQVMSIDKLLPADYNAGGREGGVPAFMRRPREELRKFSNRTDPTETIVLNESNEPGDTISNETPARHRPVTTAGVKVHAPKEMDVVLFILYAHIMMANNSFPNALSYLYRAYSLDSTNTVCLLSIALCYFHELFKRQTGNRHAYALMGWAWFGSYETERIRWAEKIDQENESQKATTVPQQQRSDGQAPKSTTTPTGKMLSVVKREIEFNKARCFEMMGMSDLGMRSYGKVLDMAPQQAGYSNRNGLAEAEQEDAEGEEEWTMEAAYAMATLYALNGNGEKAREITERYLVV